jgi:drug/metabolite transporter (DMT)-like permease
MTRLLSTSHGTNREAFSPVDWALFVTLGVIWGSSFLFMAIGLDSFHPGLVGLIRVLAASAFLYSVPRVRNSRIDRSDWPRIALIGLTWVALPFTLFPIAQQWIASGVAGMLNGATPIFTAILASVLLRHLPARVQMVGLVLGMTGVVLIALPSAQEGSTEAIGVVLGLAAAACYAVSITQSVPLLQKYGSLPVMSRVIWVALPMVAPFGLYAMPRSEFSVPSLLATLAVGVLGTGLAFILAGRLASSIGATRSAFVAYLIPVMAVILGVVFRDERVSPLALVGIGLVISGATLASRRD